MKPGVLAKTNHPNNHFRRLQISRNLIFWPSMCVVLLVFIWGNVDFLWVTPLSLSIGVILVYPVLSAIVRPSKERVAVSALLRGFVIMVIFCFLLLPLKTTPLKKEESLSREQSLLRPKVIPSSPELGSSYEGKNQEEGR